jgi:hypothetical protein
MVSQPITVSDMLIDQCIVHLLAEAGMPVRGQQFIRSTSAERASPNLEDASGSNRHNDGPRQIRSLKQKRRDSSASPEKVEKARKKNQGYVSLSES